MSLSEVQLSGRLGLTLPIGRTEPDPFALGRQGKSHQHIQFGTGTFDPLVGVDASVAALDVRFHGYAQARLTLYENRRGYQAGHQFLGGASGKLPELLGLRLSLGVDVARENAERWGGRVQQDGNLGRTDVLVGGSLSGSLANLTLSLGVKVPVYQDLEKAGDEEAQLDYPGVVNLSVTQLVFVD